MKSVPTYWQHPDGSQAPLLIAMISVKEFCQATGLCATTVNKLIKSGELPSKKAGRRRLIPVESARAWLKGVR